MSLMGSIVYYSMAEADPVEFGVITMADLEGVGDSPERFPVDDFTPDEWDLDIDDDESGLRTCVSANVMMMNPLRRWRWRKWTFWSL